LRAASALVLACVAPVLAQAKATPGESCQASQLAAASRFMKADFKCWSSLHKSPAADPGEVKLLACLEKADASFAKAYQSSLAAAGAGVCGMDSPLANVLPDLQAEVDTLAFAVVAPGFTGTQKSENTLVAALQNATGAALSAALKAESKDAKQPDEAKRLSARAKARSKLLEGFAKALGSAAQSGFAYAGPSAGSVAAEVDRIADELAALTAPPGNTSFSLSGTIRAADGSVTDSDVNDTNTVPVSNSTPPLAQDVPVPAVVGGYVNRPGAGATGHSRSLGDLADFFRVSLTAGQLVNLRFGDASEDDLELCLYDAASPATPIDCSVGTTATEQLSAPYTGNFLVEVYPWSGCACAASYVLTLGQSLAASGPTGARLGDEFAEGELVVTLASNAAGAGAKRAGASALEASFGMLAAGGAPDREMLFQLPDAASERARTLQTLGASDADAALDARFAGLPAEQRAKLETLLAAKLLRQRADVGLAEPNFIRRALTTPNDPHYALQWHYPLINLPAAWDLTTGNASVKVAVIDTGVLLAHPDLQGQLAGGFDFIASASNALDGGGIDANPDDPGDGGGLSPSSYHGTHVAGTIGAKTQNAYGVAGVAWNVTLVPLRVLGLNGGTDFDVLQAVRYAAGLPNNSGTTDKVDVINLSLGGSGFSQTAQNVFEQARNAGVIVVAAAGNQASSALVYPASYEGVVSVSAVDLRTQQAFYSSFGPAVDVAAPGGDTSSDRNGDGYGDGVLSTRKEEESGLFNFTFLQGTSMAAPHVAGVAALMKAVKPTLSPDEFDTLLAGGSLTNDLGAAGRDDVFGHGLIDARKAVEAASAAPPGTSPILLVSPTGLNLGTASTQATFQIRNGGGGSLSVTSVSDDAAWLAVAAASVDASGLGSYQVNVDRTGLAPGTYSASISVQTSTGSSSVSVVMAVVTSAASPNAGFHYVLLMDPETLDPVAQAEASAVDGSYDFAFSDVPAGSYMLFAGSDSDNDFLICGAGEACGAYPTLGSEATLEITNDRSDLDFVTGYLQSLSAADAGADEPAPRLALPRVRGRQLDR
jgi:serine protease